MGIIPTITCRKCGRQYSGLKSRCPHCGAGRVSPSLRTPDTTASVRPGTSANAQVGVNSKWQAIFGVILLVAVVAAVITLITLSLGDGEGKKPPASPSATISDVSPSMTPTASPTPTATPLPVTGIVISYGTEQKTGFAMNTGDRVPLTATVYPLELLSTATWSSTNEDVCTVDQDGVVTGVGSGWAKVVAECEGVSAECDVWVR